MALTVIIILLLLWITGFLGHIGGELIHLLLLAAVVVLLYRLVGGNKQS
jgi:hypothetical protein